jgi:hypothetical protein
VFLGLSQKEALPAGMSALSKLLRQGKTDCPGSAQHERVSNIAYYPVVLVRNIGNVEAGNQRRPVKACFISQASVGNCVGRNINPVAADRFRIL